MFSPLNPSLPPLQNHSPHHHKQHLGVSELTANMSSPPKRNLFFPADSDSEDEVPMPLVANGADSGAPSSSSDAPKREALFIADDDNEDVVVTGSTSRSSPQPSSKPSRSSPAPPSSSAGPSSRWPLKRGSSSSSQSRSTVRPGFTRGYLGEFVCEGWSLSKGRGYCSPGGKVIFERPRAKSNEKTTIGQDTSAKLGPARLVNGKVVHAKSKIGGKQMTLGGMMKKAPTPVVNALVREGTDGSAEEGRAEESRPGRAVQK